VKVETRAESAVPNVSSRVGRRFLRVVPASLSGSPQSNLSHTITRLPLQTQTGKASKFSGPLLEMPQKDIELIPFRSFEDVDPAGVDEPRTTVAQARTSELAKANEALRKCLDGLISVSELDNVLGQVMATSTRQLSASSSALFLRDDDQNFLILNLVFEDGHVFTPVEASFPERLRSIRLTKRARELAQQPAVIWHLANGPTLIPEAHRSYLLGLGVKTLLIIPLVIAGRLIGCLNFRFTEDREFRPAEIEIARALAAQTSLAVQLTRLAKTARQSAVLEERNRLAGEIHDSLAQSFAAIATQLSLASEVRASNEGDGFRYLDRAKDLARFAVAEARRTALSLHPYILDKIGLTETIEMLVERSNIPGRLQCNFSANESPSNDLPPETQQHLLRIAQEAISNAARHADATTISVSLQCDRSNLVLQIRDNGRGMFATELLSQNGFGLINMQNRAKKIGANLNIRTDVGHGTAVVVRLPISASRFT
jgi:signal transduction histidine kinase